MEGADDQRVVRARTANASAAAGANATVVGRLVAAEMPQAMFIRFSSHLGRRALLALMTVSRSGRETAAHLWRARVGEARRLLLADFGYDERSLRRATQDFRGTVIEILSDPARSIGRKSAALLQLVWLPRRAHISLNLAYTDTGDLAALAPALRDSSVRTLNLRRTSIREHCAGALAAVLPESGLAHLDLNCTQLGPLRMQILADGLRASLLTTIDLRDNAIREGSLALAAALPTSSLTTLILKQNDIGLAGAQAIAAALVESSLTSLDLGTNGITSAGLRAIADVLHRSSLNTLNVSVNRIDQDGARSLAAVLRESTLVTLDLAGNNIGTEGTLAIADKLRGSDLRHLTVGGISCPEGSEARKALTDAAFANETGLEVQEVVSRTRLGTRCG